MPSQRTLQKSLLEAEAALYEKKSQDSLRALVDYGQERKALAASTAVNSEVYKNYAVHYCSWVGGEQGPAVVFDDDSSLGHKIFRERYCSYHLTAADLAEALYDPWAACVLGIDTPEDFAAAIAATGPHDHNGYMQVAAARQAKRARGAAEELAAAPLPDYMRPCLVCKRAVYWPFLFEAKCPEHGGNGAAEAAGAMAWEVHSGAKPAGAAPL